VSIVVTTNAYLAFQSFDMSDLLKVIPEMRHAQ